MNTLLPPTVSSLDLLLADLVYYGPNYAAQLARGWIDRILGGAA